AKRCCSTSTCPIAARRPWNFRRPTRRSPTISPAACSACPARCRRTCRPRRARRATPSKTAPAASSSTPTPRRSSSSWTSAPGPQPFVRMLEPSVSRLAKDGSSRAEYEDAIAWSRRRQRFAVADGASASAFARRWAQLLVRAYVAGALAAETLEDDLAPLQQRWSSEVEQRSLPWYAVEQARRAAF